MNGGISTSAGIVFYNTKKSGDDAVLCRFDGEREVFETGRKDALYEKLKELEKPKRKDDKKRSLKIFFIAFFCSLIFIASVWIFIGGFFPVAGAFLFAALGFVPLVMFFLVLEKKYIDEKDFLQFKRFHGAEHMMLNYHAKDPSVSDFEKAKTFSPYDPECGTAYGASLFVFAAVLGLSFSLIPKIGFLWFLAAVIVSAVVLILNLLNHKNPLLLLQRAVVEKPAEKELRLAYNAFKMLIE